MKYACPEKDERSILKYYMQRYLNSEWVLECSLCAWVKEFVESKWLQKFKPIQEETLSVVTFILGIRFERTFVDNWFNDSLHPQTFDDSIHPNFWRIHSPPNFLNSAFTCFVSLTGCSNISSSYWSYSFFRLFSSLSRCSLGLRWWGMCWPGCQESVQGQLVCSRLNFRFPLLL